MDLIVENNMDQAKNPYDEEVDDYASMQKQVKVDESEATRPIQNRRRSNFKKSANSRRNTIVS